MKILALEDQPIAALRLMAVIRSLGHEADLVTDGASAIAKMEGGGYRVVVSDWKMTGVNGLDFCRAIRARGGDYVYFILVSAQKLDAENRQQALFAGVDDFLTKPIDTDELGMCLNKAERIIDLMVSLKNAISAKNKLLGMVAHDLRNPLATVRGLAEFLRDDAQTGKLNADQSDLVENIFTVSESMLEMVNEMLEVSEIEAGELKVHPKPTDLLALLERSVALNNISAAKKGSRIELTPIELFAKCQIDGPKIKQVVDNLITNAIKFSPPHSAVRVEMTQTASTIMVAVLDNGPGIPEDEMHKLFKEFSRTSVTPTAGEKSTGLGLAICRKIMEAHGGFICVENRPEGGCSFKFSIPQRE